MEFLGLVNKKTLLLRNIQTQIQAHVRADLEFKRGVEHPERPDVPMSDLNYAEADLMKWIMQAHFNKNREFRCLRLHDDRPWQQRLEEYLDKKMQELDRSQVE